MLNLQSGSFCAKFRFVVKSENNLQQNCFYFFKNFTKKIEKKNCLPPLNNVLLEIIKK